eukprot:CAMPEP_0201156208 /NCGR_PEP_ID=MMETSP0851-20130426/25920_1 /ASSEMBLY_ACC=CAM_ASM_000631 /TAXON_ID=183588 /ORGANISM="Pseudo-nitzschia fraudulenta, Strain WWA7" /LENGTH=68 /DNA_ID=CAMNT_0047434153 /DNA_START=151 /DNA_END=357 /DNA_ORIENTATION=-
MGEGSANPVVTPDNSGDEASKKAKDNATQNKNKKNRNNKNKNATNKNDGNRYQTYKGKTKGLGIESPL